MTSGPQSPRMLLGAQARKAALVAESPPPGRDLSPEQLERRTKLSQHLQQMTGLSGAGTPQTWTLFQKDVLITSDCGKMRSMRSKWL